MISSLNTVKQSSSNDIKNTENCSYDSFCVDSHQQISTIDRSYRENLKTLKTFINDVTNLFPDILIFVELP